MFSTNLRELRKKIRMSQEQLAEKLHVSRQAVTKWETNVGVPDLENLCAIADLFQISVDELLRNKKNNQTSQDYLFESNVLYDIDWEKNYDITFMGAKNIIITSYEGEKIQIQLASTKFLIYNKALK